MIIGTAAPQSSDKSIGASLPSTRRRGGFAAFAGGRVPAVQAQGSPGGRAAAAIRSYDRYGSADPCQGGARGAGVVAKVDAGSFLAIVFSAALAAALVTATPRRYAPPVVVVELLLGIIIGPNFLHWAHVDAFVEFFSNLGLGMLFFFAGYEIDFDRVRGQALTLATWGWLMSSRLPTGSEGRWRRRGL